MKQGRWLKFDKKLKKKLYEGYFVNNRPVGEFKRFHINGKESAVMFFDKSSERIRAKFYYDNGNLAAEGNYVKDKVKDSTWNYFGTDKARIATETFVNGVLHGMSTKYYRAKDKAGNIIKSEEIEYKDGKKHGIWKQYFESGKLKLTSSYINGEADGAFTFYYEGGKILTTGFYKKGLKEGKWMYSDEAGKSTIIEYVNGVAKNQAELDRAFTKQLEELEKNSKNLMDPENMQGMPEQYFLGQ